MPDQLPLLVGTCDGLCCIVAAMVVLQQQVVTVLLAELREFYLPEVGEGGALGRTDVRCHATFDGRQCCVDLLRYADIALDVVTPRQPQRHQQ